MIVEAEIVGAKEGKLWLSLPITPQIENHISDLEKTVAVELTTSESITAKQR